VFVDIISDCEAHTFFARHASRIKYVRVVCVCVCVKCAHHMYTYARTQIRKNVLVGASRRSSQCTLCTQARWAIGARLIRINNKAFFYRLPSVLKIASIES
jgi:hypothetical protein